MDAPYGMHYAVYIHFGQSVGIPIGLGIGFRPLFILYNLPNKTWIGTMYEYIIFTMSTLSCIPTY